MPTPWLQGCGSPTVRVQFSSNLFVFDRDDSTNFYVTQGCAYTCGLDFDKAFDFQDSLYWRADGGFSGYGKAFHQMTGTPPNPATCSSPVNPSRAWIFGTFSQWQTVAHEDMSGTASVNPGFGTSGRPSDYLLTSNPVAGFDYTKTNDTIRNAGRTNPVIVPPPVPHTLPTFTYTTY